MQAVVDHVANQAVFQLQLNTREAVRFIQRHAQCDEKEATRAVREVATFHKQK